jgi:hypothetical protein
MQSHDECTATEKRETPTVLTSNNSDIRTIVVKIYTRHAKTLNAMNAIMIVQKRERREREIEEIERHTISLNDDNSNSNNSNRNNSKYVRVFSGYY